MRETYAHELEGQTVIIETVPQTDGKRHPIGYKLRVRLESGLVIDNVARIDFAPILPNEPIRATLTLAHWREWHSGPDDESALERITVDARLSMAAIVEEEKHE